MYKNRWSIQPTTQPHQKETLQPQIQIKLSKPSLECHIANKVKNKDKPTTIHFSICLNNIPAILKQPIKTSVPRL